MFLSNTNIFKQICVIDRTLKVLLLYNRERQQHWCLKNISSFFSFTFITQNVRVGRVQTVEDGWDAHPGADSIDLLWNLSDFLLFVSKSLWLCNILDANGNFRGTSPTSYLHVARGYTLLLAYQPRNLRDISAGDHLRLVYFRFLVNFLWFFVLCARFSSGMLPMQFTWHVKGAFKSISNTTTQNQSTPASNSNERVDHIHQISRTGALPSDPYKCYTKDTSLEES